NAPAPTETSTLTLPDALPILAALCDRMLPASGQHPGALAAGIDRMVLADVAPLREGAVLAQLVEDARNVGFLELTAAEQDALLRSEEHTSELQSRENLVCRLL